MAQGIARKFRSLYGTNLPLWVGSSACPLPKVSHWAQRLVYSEPAWKTEHISIVFNLTLNHIWKNCLFVWQSPQKKQFFLMNYCQWVVDPTQTDEFASKPRTTCLYIIRQSSPHAWTPTSNFVAEVDFRELQKLHETCKLWIGCIIVWQYILLDKSQICSVFHADSEYMGCSSLWFFVQKNKHWLNPYK